MLQIYDQLMQFPLFQGMNRDDLEIIVGHTRFGFQKVGAGSTIVNADEPCSQLMLLIDGTVRIETSAADGGYTVSELSQSPQMLQVEAIFGYYQRYTHTYTAVTNTQFITIDKEEVSRLSEDFLVFRLNLIGIYATKIQKHSLRLWQRHPDTLRQRITRFLVDHCTYPAGPKTFHILMTRLASELNDSRLDISRALNSMQADGLLILSRGRIEVPQIERLLMA